MLFGADLPGARRFAALRAEIGRAILESGSDRKCEVALRTLPDGSRARFEIWQPPAGACTYRIYRTHATPFGIFQVFLEHPRVKLTAEVKGHTMRGGASMVEAEEWWGRQADATAGKVAAIKPGNFLVWKTRAGAVIHWAEYVADKDGWVAFRAQDGSLIKHALDDLALEQLKALRTRQWTLRDGRTIRAEFRGAFSQAKAIKWRLRQTEPQVVGDGLVSVTPAEFSAEDVSWVAAHETALRTILKP
jgi:hypothetical protein